MLTHRTCNRNRIPGTEPKFSDCDSLHPAHYPQRPSGLRLHQVYKITVGTTDPGRTSVQFYWINLLLYMSIFTAWEYKFQSYISILPVRLQKCANARLFC